MIGTRISILPMLLFALTACLSTTTRGVFGQEEGIDVATTTMLRQVSDHCPDGQSLVQVQVQRNVYVDIYPNITYQIINNKNDNVLVSEVLSGDMSDPTFPTDNTFIHQYCLPIVDDDDDTICATFNISVPENAMKWNHMESQHITYYETVQYMVMVDGVIFRDNEVFFNGDQVSASLQEEEKEEDQDEEVSANKQSSTSSTTFFQHFLFGECSQTSHHYVLCQHDEVLFELQMTSQVDYNNNSNIWNIQYPNGTYVLDEQSSTTTNIQRGMDYRNYECIPRHFRDTTTVEGTDDLYFVLDWKNFGLEEGSTFHVIVNGQDQGQGIRCDTMEEDDIVPCDENYLYVSLQSVTRSTRTNFVIGTEWKVALLSILIFAFHMFFVAYRYYGINRRTRASDWDGLEEEEEEEDNDEKDPTVTTRRRHSSTSRLRKMINALVRRSKVATTTTTSPPPTDAQIASNDNPQQQQQEQQNGPAKLIVYGEGQC